MNSGLLFRNGKSFLIRTSLRNSLVSKFFKISISIQPPFISLFSSSGVLLVVTSRPFYLPSAIPPGVPALRALLSILVLLALLANHLPNLHDGDVCFLQNCYHHGRGLRNKPLLRPAPPQQWLQRAYRRLVPPTRS